MAEQPKAKGKGFWILWSVGVVLLALLVWLGLRFYSAYAACTADHDCGSRALQTALFMERSDVARDETDNRFVKFLIKPPEQREDEIRTWLREKGPPGVTDGGGSGDARSGLHGLEGPDDNVDPHLAKRLAEDAARNAAVLGLLRAAGEQGDKDDSERNDSILGAEVPRGVPADDGPVAVAGLELRGSLSKEVVNRIIRRHVNEVKHCYLAARQRVPQLEGRVVVQFIIAATGQVVVSRIRQSSARDRELERCMTSAVRRWLFPRPPGGGIVIVSCPFVLRGER